MFIKPFIHPARNAVAGASRQAGVTLIETMIGLALSLVVVTSMVGLMSNSLGSASRVIQMAQLTDELRNAMSMLSRDIRRANFNNNAIYCYANSDCGVDSSANETNDVTITVDGVGGDNCLRFGLDRDWNGDADDDGGGAFRRDTVVNAKGQSVGEIQMWTGSANPTCADGNDWIAVTDPDFVDISEFTILDNGSFQNELTQEDGTVLTLRTRQVKMTMTGELVLDRGISRSIEDTIRVRNDIIF